MPRPRACCRGAFHDGSGASRSANRCCRFVSGRVVDASFDKSQCAVITGEGRFHFDRIVLSTGGWASLLDPLGEIRGAIKPIRGELVVLSWSRYADSARPVGTFVLHRPVAGRHVIGRRDSGGRRLRRARNRPRAVYAARAAAGDLLQDLGRATFLEVRVGLRPASSSGLPLIGPSTMDSRLVYATGHFRNGVLLAPLTAKLVAGYLLEGQRDAAFEIGA